MHCSPRSTTAQGPTAKILMVVFYRTKIFITTGCLYTLQMKVVFVLVQISGLTHANSDIKFSHFTLTLVQKMSICSGLV